MTNLTLAQRKIIQSKIRWNILFKHFQTGRRVLINSMEVVYATFDEIKVINKASLSSSDKTLTFKRNEIDKPKFFGFYLKDRQIEMTYFDFRGNELKKSIKCPTKKRD